MSPDRDVRVRLLGPPMLACDGRTADFPTRKTGALLFHLAAMPGQRIERRRLGGLLWSDTGSVQAAASLRRAVSHLSRSPGTGDLLGRDRTHLWYAGDPFDTDLALFNRCIVMGTVPALRRALELWRGEPLEGLDTGSELLDEWAQSFRAETTERAHRRLSKRLAALALGGDAELELALCELIVRIEPTDTAANVRIIRMLAARGDTAGATRRFRAFARALEDIDVAVPHDLSAFVATLAETERVPPTAPPQDAVRDWPVVALARPAATGATTNRCAVAHSEILLQLSRFRALRCFEDDTPTRPGGAASIMRVTADATHDYRLAIWDQPERRSVYVRCLNARGQYTVSCVAIDYEALADRARTQRIVAACINGIEQDILHDDEGLSGTVFGRWVQAFKLMTQWTRSSDVAALEILHDLVKDERGRRIGRVHASIGSILMIQRLILPQGSEADRDRLERAREWVFRAISVDHLDPFSHVVLGWLRVQSNDHDRGVASFEKALELNPYSCRNMIAAAEANAFCGRIDRARTLARQAVESFGPGMPAFAHGYLANIAYLAGDLEESLHHLDRAPDNLHIALLAVAVHQERGDARAAAQARVRFEQEMRRVQPEARLDGPGLSRWIESSSMIRGTHERQRMFSSLEKAGVMVSHVPGPTCRTA